jgi:uncharacterized membrane protein YhaH (DUF805 family)
MKAKGRRADKMKQTHPQRRWTDVLKHRWPTVLGIAVAVLTAFDLQVDAGFVSSISALVVLMALVYLGSAALDRRWSAWLVLLAGLPVAFFLPTTSEVGASVVLLVASFVFVVLGVAHGQLHRPGGLTLQAAGMLGFGAIALGTLYVDTVLGAYLVAAALLGHAVWDAFHYLRDRVVARSYAEFCGIADLVLGAAILLFLA